MKTPTLSKPLNLSRRKPRQRLTQAEIVAPVASPVAAQPVKTVDQGETPEHGGTPKKIATINQIKHWLKKIYPSSIGQCKPLALGSHREILKDRDDLWGYHRTVAAIRQLAQSKKYLKALAAGDSMRYLLDGTVDEPVSDDHRERARQLLDEWNKKNATVTIRSVPVESDLIPDQDHKGDSADG